MDKRQQDIDGIFGKLKDHEVKPSGLAWERLDHKLAQQQKPAFPWWRMAAVLALVMTMGALVWSSIQLTEELPLQVAQEQVLPIIPAPQQEEIRVEEKETAPAPQPNVAKKPAEQSRALASSTPSQKQPTLEAQPEQQPAREQIATIEALPIHLPEIKISLPEPENLYLAEATEVRVRIVSNGIIDAPEKENIIDLESKLEKVNSLFNKVDQGFADLQDAKNNLFATIATRKNRN